MSKFSSAISGIICLIAFASNVVPQQCPAVTKVATKLKFEKKIVEAWRLGNLATIVLVSGVNVNPDGSPRAYSVGNLGLVDIQNGAKIFDQNEYIDFDTYQKRYGHSFTRHWLAAEIDDFKLGTRQFRAFALYAPDKHSIVGNGNKGPKPQAVAGSSLLHYISMTSTRQGSYPDDDQRAYLDSGTISAFVVPGVPDPPTVIDPLIALLSTRQLAFAYHPGKNRSTFAIGGDTGPETKFGEATMAFQQLLRFGEVLPIPNYRADAKYVTCDLAAKPSAWRDCLYPGFVQFMQTSRIKAVGLSGHTVFVFFDKGTKVTDSIVTQAIIENKGQAELDKLGGKSGLGNCLRERIPELTDLLKNL